MKRGKRISAVLLAGLLLTAAALAGLLREPELLQYAFLPSGEKTAETLERFAQARDALAESFPRATLHGVRNGVTLTAGTLSRNDVCLTLAGPGWADVYPREMLSGRPLAGADAESGAKVIVLDERTAFAFFGDGDALGKSVKMGEDSFEVVGVAKHSRRVGETAELAAWAPLGAADCELMVLSAVDGSGGAMSTVFENAAAEAFSSGTLISLPKERARGTMILRWPALLLGVWLLKDAFGLLGGFWRRRISAVRSLNEHLYPGRLLPRAAVKVLPAAALTMAAVGAGALLAVLAVQPATLFPEWVPESLGDFSKWGARFWHLTATAAQPVTLKTPELAEIRFWGGLVRWGAVLSLTGVVRQMWLRKKRA